jgi:glycosyltransferase involved in cell wall biosynthesis
MPTLLFFRDYRAFQGGHLKVADYIAHTRSSGLFTPQLFMTPESLHASPFPRDVIVRDWNPSRADALFVAGMDWAHVPMGVEDHVPVINLIQHPRHALPDDPRAAFLTRRATRICVSEEVSQAIRQTGRANGPVHTIAAGVKGAPLSSVRERSIPVLICGLKNPALAQATAQGLLDRGVNAAVLTSVLPRTDYLLVLGKARIAITLPDATEGFYLPALEAMAAGCAVICPDALGNRSFCRHGETCLMPQATPQALTLAALADGGPRLDQQAGQERTGRSATLQP